MEKELADFFQLFTPAVAQLALDVRARALQALPGAEEQVDIPSKILAYGYGRRYADLILAVAPHAAHVNLMFSRGAALPDPAGLLQGTGKRARHVKITCPEDLENRALDALLSEALAAFRRG